MLNTARFFEYNVQKTADTFDQFNESILIPNLLNSSVYIYLNTILNY